MLSYTHNNDLVDGNHTIGHINNDMTSSTSSIVHYHLLNCDINEIELMEQDYEIKNNEYLSFSSSAPTIIYTDDLEKKSNRWELDLSIHK